MFRRDYPVKIFFLGELLRIMRIILEKVCKYFGQNLVIDKMDLEVQDGEMMALLGPSGCGKTTTLLSICGIHRISSGKVIFGERIVNDLAPQERNTGVVFQSYALYPHLNAYENIAFPLRIRKEGNAEIDQKVKDIVAILRIEELLERRPSQLSGGQQQRVALARALVRNPDVLLLDEPLANLDAGLRMEMRSEIRRIQQTTRFTAILVTHDQVEAMSMCDRIALMNKGKIQQTGTPMEMYHQPKTKFVAGFIGSPPISFLKGIIEDNQFKSEGISFEIHPKIKNIDQFKQRQVLIGIRPEHIQPEFEQKIRGEITFVEIQGRDILYNISLSESNTVRSIQTGEPRYQQGEQIEWGIDTKSVLFFDEDEKRIG